MQYGQTDKTNRNIAIWAAYVGVVFHFSGSTGKSTPSASSPVKNHALSETNWDQATF